jgi:hypothetical protein
VVPLQTLESSSENNFKSDKTAAETFRLRGSFSFKMKKKLKFVSTLILIQVACLYCYAGQKELIEKRVKELIELNKIVVGNSIDLEKYNNQTVFIKARLQQISEKDYKVKVEEISTDEIKGKEGSRDTDDGTVVVRVKISKNPDKSFFLDLEHVLPPEKNESNIKEKGNSK